MPNYRLVPFGIPEVGKKIRVTLKDEPADDVAAFDARVVIEVSSVGSDRKIRIGPIGGNQPFDIRESTHDIYLEH